MFSRGEGEDAGNKTLGGAAAYQAFLWVWPLDRSVPLLLEAEIAIRIWDRDHHTAYHTYPTQENRERLVGLAVAERESVSSDTEQLYFNYWCAFWRKLIDCRSSVWALGPRIATQLEGECRRGFAVCRSDCQISFR